MDPERSKLARRAWVVLAPLGLLALLLHRVLSPQVMLFRRDLALYYLPLKEFVARELEAGRLSAWYPYDGLGVSLVGTAASGLFHPTNLLSLFLSPDQALKWQVLLAYAFAALGTARLSRRLGASRAGQALAAVGYSASGWLLSVHNNLPYVLTAATLPWTLLAADALARRARPRSAAALAGALWLSLAGGDVQGTLVQAAAALFVALVSRPRRGAGPKRAATLAAGYAAFALAALPMLLPMWASLSLSARAAGFSLEEAQAWPLHPLRLLELATGPLLPPSWISEASPALNAIGGTHGGLWSQSELVGVPVVALALAALLRPLPRRLKVHAGLGAAALLLALGPYGGLYALLHRAVPLWSAFRYPEKLMPLAILSWCLLAGWAARRLPRPDRRRTGVWAALLVVLLAWTAAAPSVVASWFAGATGAGESLAFAGGVARGSALFAAALLMPMLFKSVLGWRHGGVLALGLQGLQVLALSGWVVGTVPRAQWLSNRSPFAAPASEAIAAGAGRICWDLAESRYENLTPPDREELWFLDSLHRTLGPGAAAREGIATVPTYGPGDDGAFAGPCGQSQRCPSPCSRVAGAGLGIVDAEQYSNLSDERRLELDALERSEDPLAVLYRDPLARPFASLPAMRHVSAEKARAEIYRPDRVPADEAIVIGAGEDRPAPRGRVKASWPAPDRVVAEVSLEEPGTLVLAMTCDPGWSAKVDGERAALGRADGTLCALGLGPGRHRVELEYRPVGWPWAFAGPLAALVIGGSLSLATRSRRRLSAG